MSKILKIKIKYSSKCKECAESLLEGDQAYFEPESKDYLKLTCLACYESTTDDLDSIKEAKKRLSTNDLSSPKQDCNNELCSNQTSTRSYFCPPCYHKLPKDLQNKVDCVYGEFLKNRKYIIARGDLARVHYQCLGYFEQPTK